MQFISLFDTSCTRGCLNSAWDHWCLPRRLYHQPLNFIRHFPHLEQNLTAHMSDKSRPCAYDCTWTSRQCANLLTHSVPHYSRHAIPHHAVAYHLPRRGPAMIHFIILLVRSLTYCARIVLSLFLTSMMTLCAVLKGRIFELPLRNLLVELPFSSLTKIVV